MEREFDVTKMSSRGQIVIPQELREYHSEQILMRLFKSTRTNIIYRLTKRGKS